MSAAAVRFSVIGMNHFHVYSMADTLIAAGAELVSYFAAEPDLSAAFGKKYSQAKAARSEAEILEDKSIQVVASAAIPCDRAALGMRVMRHGKDYFVDKPGLTTLEQLAEVRKVQAETKRFYTIYYGERLETAVTEHAGELCKAGAIGKVVQTLGRTAPRESGESAPVVFQEGAVRRNSGRHWLPSVRTVSVFHEFDGRDSRRVAGEELQAPAASGTGRFRRLHAEQFQWDGLPSRGLVHAGWAFDVRRCEADYSRH